MAEGVNKMCICGKKLFYFIWLWIYSKEIKPDLNYSVKSYNFSMRCGLHLSSQSASGLQRKI